jgi:alkanesulfonate monooxygenase SsuD/methylene tetrahydromethanopterin reductase-like flavin-dependent oxidoreductase (luciferase family)
MFRQMRNTVRSACEAQDRDPDDLVYSIAQVVCAGKDDEEVALRAGAIGRSAADLRENAIAGTPSEILDRIADYAEAGADRVYLQVLDFTDLDHVSLLGEQVLALLP